VVALHVRPGILQDISDIGSRVPDRDLARDMLRDVVFEVALDSLKIINNSEEICWPLSTYSDVHRVVLCCTQIVYDFIRGEEAKGVWQVLEILNDTEHARKIVRVVRSPWFCAVDAFSWQGRVDVEDHVDPSGIEDRSAL
jgi:hypothetical protein